jgi:predicted branched-subunit amino acid permease
VGFSLFGVGSLARDAGLPAGAAVLSTCLMWAAPAQVILFGGLLGGAALPALAVAIGVSSLRFLPMTMSILPLLRRPGQRWPVQVAAAHLVAVTAWVEGMRRLPNLPAAERLPYFFGFGLACMGVSAALTLAGYQLVRILPLALAAGMLMLTPLFFTIALVASARTRQDWTAIGLGFALAPVATILVGRDFDLLTLGLVGGTAAYAVGRTGRRA